MGLWCQLVDYLRNVAKVRATIRVFNPLDDRILADIGLQRHDLGLALSHGERGQERGA